MGKVADSDIKDVACNARLRHNELEKLYLQLGMEAHDIELAQRLANTDDFQLQAVGVLKSWRQANGSRATRRLILNALQDCGFLNAKETLDEKWSVIDKDDDLAPPSSRDETNIQISDLEFHEQLGRGAYGIVYKVTFKKPYLNAKEAAAKRVTVADLREEAELMKDLDHPNIVKLYGLLDEHMGTKILLLEYAPYGTISDYLSQHQGSRISIRLLKKWARESALALLYLHKKRVLHRDVKASNALLFVNDVLKLSDFGLAREMGESETTSTAKGTWRYMAPEIHTDNHFSFKSDIYSYGMLVLEIGTGKPPFSDLELSAHVVFIVATENAKPTIPPHLPEALRELIFCCWNAEPNERPSLEEALEVIDGIVDVEPEEPTEKYPDQIQMVALTRQNNHQDIDDSSQVQVFINERNSDMPVEEAPTENHHEEPTVQTINDQEPSKCLRHKYTVAAAIIAFVGLLVVGIVLAIELPIVLPRSAPLALTCPQNQVSTAPTGQSFVPVTYNGVATPTGGSTPYTNVTYSPPSGSVFVAGETLIVTASARDSANTVQSCTFTVTVTGQPINGILCTRKKLCFVVNAVHILMVVSCIGGGVGAFYGFQGEATSSTTNKALPTSSRLTTLEATTHEAATAILTTADGLKPNTSALPTSSSLATLEATTHEATTTADGLKTNTSECAVGPENQENALHAGNAVFIMPRHEIYCAGVVSRWEFWLLTSATFGAIVFRP